MKSKNLKDIIYNQNEGPAWVWQKGMKKSFQNFTLVGHTSMLGLMLLIFQKKATQ